MANGQTPLFDGAMKPPRLPNHENDPGELGDWNRQYGRDFDLGTLYTMVAGLLNILVIYDALDGPAIGDGEPTPPDDPKKPDDDKTSPAKSPPKT